LIDTSVLLMYTRHQVLTASLPMYLCNHCSRLPKPTAPSSVLCINLDPRFCNCSPRYCFCHEARLCTLDLRHSWFRTLLLLASRVPSMSIRVTICVCGTALILRTVALERQCTDLIWQRYHVRSGCHIDRSTIGASICRVQATTVTTMLALRRLHCLS
jgi:hypothetical protein